MVLTNKQWVLHHIEELQLRYLWTFQDTCLNQTQSEKKNVSIHTISQINGFIQGVIQHFIALLKMNLPN